MKFLMFFVLSLCIGLNFACSSNDSSESNLPAITKKPIVIVNPTSRLANQDRGGSSRNKALDREVELPMKLWQSFEYQMIKFRGVGGGGGTQQDEFCGGQGEPSELKIGISVTVLEEARCIFSQFQEDGDGSPKRYSVSLTKIRINDTGEEGWTWIKAIKLNE